MLSSYKTIKEYGEETIIIKKSRFIGYALPVETEEEAIRFVEAIRKKHWDATHNCYAYQIGSHDEIQRSNDDGEPAGTAGKPILEVIRKEGLKNTAVVVTRYFGGIMLGAGGLVRAYGQTAGAALKAAGIVTRSLFQTVYVGIDYTWLGKVENETLQAGYFVDSTEYSDRVRVSVLVPAEEAERYTKLITNATHGQAEIALGEPVYAMIQNGKLVR
ncbi:YigZ family protein [Effusibacillus lacus]|uniref:YigZ family protein n=1 Tax=Effusibacillus lacus TaxID=1348429 RepID=A0A292YLJ7_9BACL|nr:YigZ family protein [Effusibacillus lacus]TCS71789.1 putative YigZ family protein [Effusibacillus lacus]GAX89643.1 YigZ family protein [Effusibacillus lacus]